MLRVILHLDCDCFYAQVELQRLQLPRDSALCVVQWGMALAVSYGARVHGIKRGDSVGEIRRKGGSSEVHIVSVETRGHRDDDARFSDIESAAPPVWDVDGQGSLKSREKVSLARYRLASSQVFDAITSRLTSGCSFERASIDEAFLDVSQVVHERLTTKCDRNCDNPHSAECLPGDTVVYDGSIHCKDAVYDRYLREGARLAAELRGAVFSTTGFTLSAGIAANKMLAKFASSQNKPNLQTIIFPDAVPALLSQVPISDFRGCGGKLGKMVEDLGFKTAAAVKDGMALEKLEALVGKRHAQYLWGVCNGIDESEVIQRRAARTLLAAKNFEKSMNVGRAVSWMHLLAREIVERLDHEEKQNRRFARTLTCSFRLLDSRSRQMSTISRSDSMPADVVKDRLGAIVDIARRLLFKALEGVEHTLPISFIGISGSNFVSRSRGKAAITSFLSTMEVNGGESLPDVGPGCEAERAVELSKSIGTTNLSKTEVVAEEGRAESSHFVAPSSVFGMTEKLRGSANPRERIDTYFLAQGSLSNKGGRSRDESDRLYARRLQEAADSKLARRLMRQEQTRSTRDISKTKRRQRSIFETKKGS